MKNLKIKQDPRVKEKFESYPEEVRVKLEYLRKLVIETASEIEHIEEIEETLKWGEPSYLAKNGSTLRMDWKAKNPAQYAMYFKCTSKLVPSFKILFGELFKYEKTRAILFDLEEKVPVQELKVCIELALTYHLVKDKEFLGKG